jgi:hypothetical protein
VSLFFFRLFFGVAAVVSEPPAAWSPAAVPGLFRLRLVEPLVPAGLDVSAAAPLSVAVVFFLDLDFLAVVASDAPAWSGEDAAFFLAFLLFFLVVVVSLV